MKKIILVSILLIIGLIIYNLGKPNLTLITKTQNDKIELYLLKEDFNYKIVKDLLADDFPFTNVTIIHNDKYYGKIISLEKLNLKQESCEKIWDCPVLVVSPEVFQKILQEDSKDPFKNDITQDVTEDRNLSN